MTRNATNQEISIFRGFVQDESGATAIEYSLVAVLIAFVIIGSVTLLGSRLSTLYSNTAAAF